MPRLPRNRSRTAREPVQVYLAADDSALLSRMAESTGLSKAEILRRGIRSFAAEQHGKSPMLQFLTESGAEPWPDDVAANHDGVLADAYRASRRKRR